MDSPHETLLYESLLYTAIASIPPGKVATYGQLAALAERPNGARWVGRCLKELPEGSRLPWHRVINAQGSISLPMDSGGQEQAERLRAEGVLVSATGKIRLADFQWLTDNG